MKEKILIKSVLEGYRFIDKVVKKLDANVVTKGVNSFVTHGFNETLNLANDILYLSSRKKKLLNLKGMIDDCIKTMPSQSGKLIVLKYFDGLTNIKLAEMFGFGVKKIAKLLDRALINMALYFCSLGFNLQSLLHYLKDEDWLIGIYKEHIIKYASRFSNKQVVAYYI